MRGGGVRVGTVLALLVLLVVSGFSGSETSLSETSVRSSVSLLTMPVAAAPSDREPAPSPGSATPTSGLGCTCLCSPIAANEILNTTTTGPCTVTSDATIDPRGTLVVFASDRLVFGNTSLATTLYDNGTLIINEVGSLSVLAGASVTLQIWGHLTIQGSSELTLSSLSTLVLEPGSVVTIDVGSRLVMAQATLEVDGGYVNVNGGSWVGNVQDDPSTVADLAINGPLTDLNLTGVNVDGLSLTAGLQALTLQGYYQSSSSGQFMISALNVSSVKNFLADDVDLSGVVVTAAENVTLGRPAMALDEVTITSLTVSTFVAGTLTVANANVSSLDTNGAARVVVSGSTFQGANVGVSDATLSLNITKTDFADALTITGSSTVHLVNVTAPSLDLAGPTSTIVDNWAQPTVHVSSQASCGINVTNPHGWADLFRFLEVQFTGTTLAEAGTVLRVHDTILGTTSSVKLGQASNALSLYLLTDNITFGTDTFVGEYQIDVSTPNGLNATGSVNLTGTGATLTLTLASVAPAPSYTLLTFATVAGLAAVTGATVYLWAQTRRQRARAHAAAPSAPQDEDEAEDEAAAPPGGQ